MRQEHHFIIRWEKEERAGVEAARKRAGQAAGEDGSEEAREAWLLRLRLALVRSVDAQALLLQVDSGLSML